MPNESFDWLETFVPERIVAITLEHDPYWTPSGIKCYRGSSDVQGVFVKNIRSQDAGGTPQKTFTVLLTGTPSVSPGDRITAREGTFEIDSVEECCDLQGNVVIRKCQIK